MAKAKENRTPETSQETASVTIKPPRFMTAEYTIRGSSPYVQHRFWKKVGMMQKHKEGSSAKTKKDRSARDFEDEAKQATYRTAEGWHGIPATAFRSAMIDACRLVGLTMTRAKLAVFVEADGIDLDEGCPLVKITKGKPKTRIDGVRNETGVTDMRARPMWTDWQAKVRVKFDLDILSPTDATNLLARAGMQVGVGEGRPNSKKSHGCGWGTFEIVND